MAAMAAAIPIWILVLRRYTSPMKLGSWFSKKIIKIFATKCQILRLKCTKIDFGWGCFSPEVEIWPFRACAVHPIIIIGTVRSSWTWLWCRYHVPQNVFLVFIIIVYVPPCCIWWNKALCVFCRYMLGAYEMKQESTEIGQNTCKDVYFFWWILIPEIQLNNLHPTICIRPTWRLLNQP